MKREVFGGFILEIGKEEIFLHYKRTFDDYLAYFIWAIPVLIWIIFAVYDYGVFWSLEGFSFLTVLFGLILLFVIYACIKFGNELR